MPHRHQIALTSHVLLDQKVDRATPVGGRLPTCVGRQRRLVGPAFSSGPASSTSVRDSAVLGSSMLRSSSLKMSSARRASVQHLTAPVGRRAAPSQPRLECTGSVSRLLPRHVRRRYNVTDVVVVAFVGAVLDRAGITHSG